MTRKLTLLLLAACLCLPFGARAQQLFTLSGTVTEKGSGEPVEFATVVLATGQWGVCDAKGAFTIAKVPGGKTTVTVSCVGYVEQKLEISVARNITNLKFSLPLDNLALEGAVVTAQESTNSATTSRTIDKTALEHVQLMNVADISSLMPGGATTSNELTAEKQFNIRASSGESGNASFGTAVEVDGVRLSSNASFASASSSESLKGVNTNNIASTNVESVEVITGVPSVEYGDMASGVVKINTRKGKTPWTVSLSTSPNTKQTSVSKGFSLGSFSSGASRGVLNTSLEYTQSISRAMSPYTAYSRSQASVSWSNTLNKGLFAQAPLRVTVGMTGNLGGMNSTADPDAVQGTWSKGRDDAIRGNFSLNWLLSKSWITNLELTGSLSYSNKTAGERTYKSSSGSEVVLHGREAGYYMAQPYTEGAVPPVKLIPAGYWYNELWDDDRPLTTKLTLKANQSSRFGRANNRVKAGVDWSTDYNFGIGTWSPDMSTAPTFREYRYCDKPMMHNVGLYLEDNIMFPVGKGRINLIAGLRNDNTYIRGSAYGLTSSLSPRFNFKYTILDSQGRSKKTIRNLSLRASWGEAVKLPSFSILFPMPTYRDERVFTSTSNSANESFRAYYIQPRTVEYNPDLRWQRNRMSEIGIETDILGNRISLTGFWNQTLDTYRLANDYERLSYSYTPDAVLAGVPIAADDRVFSINQTTGIVTVSDKTGVLPSQELPAQTYKALSARYYPENSASPINRYGIEWVIDFAQIKAIHTQIRIDGTWYSYRSVLSDIIAYSPTSYRSSQDGLPYRYIGYYYGDNAYSNGSETQSLRNNVTLTTHIPRIRLILSVKLEASLLKYSRTLSERTDGTELARVISDKSDILSTTGESIYGGEHYVVKYPEYYCTYDDPTPHNYLEDLQAARAAGNNKLFDDLWQLAYKSNYLYMFNKDYLSPFFSANFSVTKEIGNLASISFYANNFFNNKAQIYSTKTRTKVSSSSYIPRFYYGLTVRFKF